MALSGKNISGYSKIEQQNFSSASFTDSGAQIFDGTEVVNIMEQISATLNSISNEYDAIRKGYNKCLNDFINESVITTVAVGAAVLVYSKKIIKFINWLMEKSTDFRNKAIEWLQSIKRYQTMLKIILLCYYYL